jgi:hypothetical protein
MEGSIIIYPIIWNHGLDAPISLPKTVLKLTKVCESSFISTSITFVRDSRNAGDYMYGVT